MTPTEEIVSHVLRREGGVADVGDGKGVTRYGQTPNWLAQFGLPTPTSPAEAATNYEKWLDITGLQNLVTVADSLSDIIVDIAVMSSHQKAIKVLQVCLHVLPVDGVLGSETLKALLSSDRSKLAKQVIAADMEYQGSLITLNPQRAQYAKGWAARMAEHVRNL